MSERPEMQAVLEAYANYINERDAEAVAVLRARADLAEAIQKARKAGISIPTQAKILDLDRTWVFRLSRGNAKPFRSPVIAVSRLMEGTRVGQVTPEWAAELEEKQVTKRPPLGTPQYVDEVVIVPDIPDCRYCSQKATRVIMYGNKKQAMVCDYHAPQLPEGK